MKRLMLAALLAFSASASAELSNWSVDDKCTASAGVDWSPTNTGHALLAFNGMDNTLNVGVTNQDWSTNNDIEENVTILLGSKYKVQARGYGFAKTNLIVLQIPYTEEMERQFISSKYFRVYDSQGSLLITLELIDIDQAMDLIYSCYTGSKA